jgi:hypothetical protein
MEGGGFKDISAAVEKDDMVFCRVPQGGYFLSVHLSDDHAASLFEPGRHEAFRGPRYIPAGHLFDNEFEAEHFQHPGNQAGGEAGLHVG